MGSWVPFLGLLRIPWSSNPQGLQVPPLHLLLLLLLVLMVVVLRVVLMRPDAVGHVLCLAMLRMLWLLSCRCWSALVRMRVLSVQRMMMALACRGPLLLLLLPLQLHHLLLLLLILHGQMRAEMAKIGLRIFNGIEPWNV